VQFLASYGDDASCLNLNEVSNPRILAADPSLLRERFSFARGSRWLDSDEPWESLDMEFSPSGSRPDETGSNLPGELPGAGAAPVIPAIADQAVIQWGLGKRVGDTLTYLSERGDEIKLLLIGGLANSVFQGNVIISEKHFLKHFPSASGSSFFLIDALRDREEEIREEMDFIFRDHGWEMTTTTERLNEFNSVENTYLAIFLLLGAFGVLLGTVGLSVVMARSIMERKSEIALYSALGYQRRQIHALLFREYIVLLLGGLAAGLPPALIAGFPSLLSASRQDGPLFLVLLVTVILVNGVLWIAATSWLVLKNINITGTLGND
jgi:putative ABC transport system permease protein